MRGSCLLTQEVSPCTCACVSSHHWISISISISGVFFFLQRFPSSATHPLACLIQAHGFNGIYTVMTLHLLFHPDLSTQSRFTPSCQHDISIGCLRCPNQPDFPLNLLSHGLPLFHDSNSILTGVQAPALWSFLTSPLSPTLLLPISKTSISSFRKCPHLTLRASPFSVCSELPSPLGRMTVASPSHALLLPSLLHFALDLVPDDPV